MDEAVEKLFTHTNFKHLNGDSTLTDSYKQLLASEKVNLILADPPYLLLKRRNKEGQLRDPKRAKIYHHDVRRFENVKEYKIFTQSWMDAAAAYLEQDAYFIIWTNFLGRDPISDQAKKLNLHFHGEFIWAKYTSEKKGNERMARVYEVALVFSKLPAKEKDVSHQSIAWSVVTDYDQEKEGEKWGLHPNHKTFSAIEPLIRNFTRPGETILDPFTGSGSTPLAALKLKRMVFGIELSQEWSKTTRERYLDFNPEG